MNELKQETMKRVSIDGGKTFPTPREAVKKAGLMRWPYFSHGCDWDVWDKACEIYDLKLHSSDKNWLDDYTDLLTEYLLLANEDLIIDLC